MSQVYDQLLTSVDLDSLTTAEIQHCLQLQDASAVVKPIEPGKRRAAVLVPFVRVSGQWHLLYIRRAESERDRHSGQVAFAGGKEEPCDHSLVETALRETREEIGIPAEKIKVLGELVNHYSITNISIRPVVAEVEWPCELQLDSAEVAHAFTIPLTWLADPNNREERMRDVFPGKDPVAVTYFKKYEKELLWGATARITLTLLKQLALLAHDV